MSIEMLNELLDCGMINHEEYLETLWTIMES